MDRERERKGGKEWIWNGGFKRERREGEEDSRRINKRETRADTGGEIERERNEGGSEGK